MNSDSVSGLLPPPQPASTASASKVVPVSDASDPALRGIRGSVATGFRVRERRTGRLRTCHPRVRVAALSAGRIYLDTLRTCASRAGFLLALGALVFVPLGLLDALVDRAGSIHVASLSALDDLSVAALVAGFIAQSATSLLGEVFYSGAVALHLAPGRHLSLLEVARKLSFGRLIAVDLVFGVGIAVGLALLIVPGVILFTWFALAGPVIEL